ncbi:hypothetical protein PS634_03492 [Pseudomonas fluorescens]|nr:hypothetical protein PS634_03492 [Pseudomonas fluorescens]
MKYDLIKQQLENLYDLKSEKSGLLMGMSSIVNKGHPCWR